MNLKTYKQNNTGREKAILKLIKHNLTDNVLVQVSTYLQALQNVVDDVNGLLQTLESYENALQLISDTNPSTGTEMILHVLKTNPKAYYDECHCIDCPGCK